MPVNVDGRLVRETDLCVDERSLTLAPDIDPFRILTDEERVHAEEVKAGLEAAEPFLNTVVLADAIPAPPPPIPVPIITGSEHRYPLRTATAPSHDGTVCDRGWRRQREDRGSHGPATHFISQSYGRHRRREPGLLACQACIRSAQRHTVTAYQFLPIPVGHDVRPGYFMLDDSPYVYRISINRHGLWEMHRRFGWADFGGQPWMRIGWASTLNDFVAMNNVAARISNEGFDRAGYRFFQAHQRCMGCGRTTYNTDGFGGHRCRTLWRQGHARVMGQ